jgi:hypothetical protein
MNSRKRKPAAAMGSVLGQGVGNVANACSLSQEDWEREQAEARAQQLAQVGATLRVLGPTLTTILDQVAAQITSAMVANGFWSGEQDNFGSKTALVHSELSEMLEANRKGIEADDKLPDFTGEEAEAADTVIRLLDMAGRYNWRLSEAITAKMLFNLERPFKHGKKY